jgi:hypothetical protein
LEIGRGELARVRVRGKACIRVRVNAQSCKPIKSRRRRALGEADRAAAWLGGKKVWDLNMVPARCSVEGPRGVPNYPRD